MNQIDLKGRNAVVTGGAQGIGRAVTERLLRSGASVAIWDHDAGLSQKTAAELSAHGKVIAVLADVTSWDSIEAAAKETAGQLGGIDILVNNAGIAGPNAPVDAYPLEAWQQVIDIDLTGVFQSCRAVVPLMKAK
ncbi:MAG: SDR family NAD(P)-dependent oxidoreductase, partial [Ferrovibrio sp.]